MKKKTHFSLSLTVKGENGRTRPLLSHPLYLSATSTQALQRGGEHAFDQVLELYKNAQLNEEKVRCLSVLGATMVEHQAQAALDMLLDATTRTQDLVSLAYSVCTNHLWRRLAWQFLQQNYDDLAARYGGGRGVHWGSFLGTFVEHFNEEAVVEEVVAFFASKSLGSAARSIAQAVEKVRARAAWLAATDLPASIRFLTANFVIARDHQERGKH